MTLRPGLFLPLLALLPQGPLLAQEEPAQTTLGGYGEIHYTNFSGPNTPGTVNVKRFVLFLSHGFSDRIAFRGELELEDTKLEGGASGGEIALEQAYLDYRFSPAFTLRTGLVLVPIGIVNELHEPPTFNGVARPVFDREVIPTTWREIGIGLAGQVAEGSGLAYRAYLVSGLRAEGFTGAAGIRGGRQEGREASFANPSFTGRLEWARPGIKVGGAFWYGGSANQDRLVGRGTFDAAVLVLAADARYDVGPLAFRAEVARMTIAGAGAINRAYGQDLGSRIEGGYLEGAVDLLRAFRSPGSQRLLAFLRHERYDLHAAVSSGIARNGAYARRVTTMGLSYKPLWNVVFKADYQWRGNRAGAGEAAAAALGVGYQF